MGNYTLLLHASETWAPTVGVMQRLQRNDQFMIRWICSTRSHDRTSSTVLLSKLGLADITSVLRSRRLRWYGHVQLSTTGINTITKFLNHLVGEAVEDL